MRRRMNKKNPVVQPVQQKRDVGGGLRIRTDTNPKTQLQPKKPTFYKAPEKIRTVMNNFRPIETSAELVEYRGQKYTCHYAKCLHSLTSPAFKNDDGSETWYKFGVVHRDDGPAIIKGGDKFWYKDGVLHNADGPAIIRSNGTKEYYLDGVKQEEEEIKLWN